jgi:hypothetical protein
MADRVHLVGGPLDGHEVGRRPGKYAWVCGKLTSTLWTRESRIGEVGLKLLPGARALFIRGGAAACQPRNGAALYEDVGDGVLLYAGHRTVFCNACKTYHPRCEGGSERRPCALGGEDADR